MNSITVSKAIAAPQQAVWDVLADFTNIANWNTGVAVSFHSGGPEEIAIGSKRHCDLKPMGGLDETLIVMDEPDRAVVRIDKATRIPIKNGQVEFLLDGDGDTTDTTINYSYNAKGGPLSPIIGKLLEGQLRTGFGGFLDDLELAAQGTPA